MSAEVESHENQEPALLSRIQSYGVVSAAADYYQQIKNYSPLATKSLQFCENVVSRGVEVTIPVYRKVDEYAHIEQRSVALLDAIETKAAKAKEGLAKANHVAHQPLDSLIDALDAYIPLASSPPSSPATSEPGETESSSESSAPSENALVQAKELPTTQKLTAIGSHLGQAGMLKLRELQLRGPNHWANAQQAKELLSYAAAVLHLDTMYDRSAAAIADTQHALFARAATAATNMHTFIEKHPRLMQIEESLKPYALTTKSVVEGTALRLLASLHAGMEITSDFFANRTSDFAEISKRAAGYASGIIQSVRKVSPDLEKHIASLLGVLRGTFSLSQEKFNYAVELSKDNLSAAVTAMYSLLNQLFSSISTFRQQLVLAGKQESELTDFAANYPDSTAEDAPSYAEVASTSVPKSKRRASRK